MIKSFTVGVKHHVNLGNYESMEVEAQVTMEVPDDGKVLKICAKSQELLAQLLAETFHSQKEPEWFNEIPLKKARKTVLERKTSNI